MKTAVEWLVEQITKNTWYDEEGFGHVSVSILDINKAKEMEKRQITSAYNRSTYQFANDAEVIAPKSALEYYNQTFKK